MRTRKSGGVGYLLPTSFYNQHLWLFKPILIAIIDLFWQLKLGQNRLVGNSKVVWEGRGREASPYPD